MTDRPTPAERLTLEYLAALDAGDLDAVARIWEQAAGSPKLGQLITEATEEAAREVENEFGPAPNRERVLGLLREQLPSAFPAEPAEPRPVTVGEVAARLKAGPELRGFPATDLGANERLLHDVTVMPGELGQPQLERWTAGLPVSASARYWKLFRKAALLLNMSRSHEGTKLAAARMAKKQEKSE